MTFDLQTILESKEARRRYLASRPVAEKLRLLDAMRESDLTIRGRNYRKLKVVREKPEPRRTSR